MADPNRGAGPTRAILTVAVWAALPVFLYYWALLTDGKFLQAGPLRHGLVFNSMIEHLARGAFDVDPSTILKEGFTRDGRTYAYFGVFPALFRAPFLIFPKWRDLDITALSCAAAATLAALGQLAAVSRAGRLIRDQPHGALVTLGMTAMVIFGGAQVQFLRPSVYQESIFWAGAFASLFVMMAFRWCVDITGRRDWHMVAMAVLAGLCLNTRVSTSIGLYAACAALVLARAVPRLAKRQVRAAVRALLPPLLPLLGFAALCAFVNYQRWGNPLTFQDYRYYNTVTATDPVHAIIRAHGFFSLERIPFGLSYYFLPVWAIIGASGEFLFRATQNRLYFLVEPPPATFLLSDPWLCFLSALGFARLFFQRITGVDKAPARIAALALGIPGGLMVMAIAVTFRYRAEFYPGFEFLALFGMLSFAAMIPRRPRLWITAAGAMIAVGILVSHLGLIVYKVTPWGDYLPVEQTGWRASYERYFIETYPALEGIVSGRGRPASGR